MPVDTPHPGREALKAQWKRLRDCDAGRDAIIAAGTEYLPDLPGNPGSDYTTRGSFFNAVRRTRQGLTGAITQKAPTFTLPQQLEDIEDDIARPRQSAQAFVKRTLDEVLLMGRYGVLVDMAAREGQHPYLVAYTAEDIWSWRVEERAGTDVLTRVVLRENVTEPDPKDEFAFQTVEQFRVLDLTDGGYTQTVWRKVEGKQEWAPTVVAGADEATLKPVRRGVPLDFLPFVFLGPTSESVEPEAPPLIDLADVNLGLWRNSADYEYALHLVALPTPWVSGPSRGEDTGPKKIGPSVVWELGDGGAAGMLEYSGQGVASIKAAMDGKKQEMASLGARLLEEQPDAAETATAVGMRHAGEHATLRTVASAVSDALTRALRIVEWWMGTLASPEDCTAAVDLNQEFFAVKASPDEIRAAMMAWQAGGISFETWYERLVKGGWAREGIEAKEEKAEIEREAPPPPDPEPEPEPGAPALDGEGNPIPVMMPPPPFPPAAP